LSAAGSLSTERDGTLAVVRFANPPRHFLDAKVVDELYVAVRELEREPGVRAVVLAGAEPGAWFTHYDPAEILAGARGTGVRFSHTRARLTLAVVRFLMKSNALETTLRRSSLRGLVTTLRLERVYEVINRSDKAYIAALDGVVFGAGCILALACDLRIAARELSAIGLPEPVLGFVPPGGVTRLTRLVGPGQAIELLLTGRYLSSADAADLGLVHAVVPRERLLDEARETAASVARRSPAMVRELKRTVYDATTRPLAAGFAAERAAFIASTSTPFTVSAMEAFFSDAEHASDSNELLASWRRARDRVVSDT
jgi:enoyl-CoA hydratase/carnithine racemase